MNIDKMAGQKIAPIRENSRILFKSDLNETS